MQSILLLIQHKRGLNRFFPSQELLLVSKGGREGKRGWETEKEISEELRSYLPPQSRCLQSPALAGFGYFRISGALSCCTTGGSPGLSRRHTPSLLKRVPIAHTSRKVKLHKGILNSTTESALPISKLILQSSIDYFALSLRTGSTECHRLSRWRWERFYATQRR